MATAAPQAAMQMPQQGASPFADPNAMAVYDQLRQTTSPKAFGDEMLAGAAQADPQAVAKFLQKLQSLNVPPEVLDALNNVVDEILANPERYDELRAKYIAQGLPEKILPAQFDPQFFVALNMAIDQMIAEPAGVQSFAQGGIAGLKPIAKAIASYGRNGDTMLAHITPAEARMLRRRGGSGTTNPDTGLPEFFLDEIFGGIGDARGDVGDAIGDAIGGIGDAVQDFVSSEVGQMITTVAIGYFLGPVVAAQFGVTSAVGVAAISGFVGGAGGTLLGGGSFEDALKAGAIGGLTAGAGAGVMGGSEAFAARPSITPGQAFTGQVDKFTGMFSTPQTPIATLPDTSSTVTQASGAPNLAPAPQNPLIGDAVRPVVQPSNINATSVNNPLIGDAVRPVVQPTALTQAPVNQVNTPPAAVPPAASTAPTAPYKTPTIGESLTKMGEGLGFGDKPASFDTFKQGAGDLFAPGPTTEQLKLTPEYADAMSKGKTMTEALGQAAQANAPGMLRTYGPATVAGLGALSAFGGFETKPVQSGPITKELTKPVTQRIAEKGTQRQMYSQGLPGVVYDQYGAPVYGQSVRLPTYDAPDYNSGGYGMPQGGINLPTAYISPPGTIGSRRVEQPYNNSDMYPNLVPRQYAADGGLIQKFAFGGDAVGDSLKDVLKSVSPYTYSPEEQAAQKAARDAVAQQKALRKSQGSGQMYSNINAGLAALAPETNPMYPGPVGDLYRNILRREPDAGGYEFWKSQFGDTVDEKERAAFQGSAALEIAARKNFVGEPAYQTFGAQNRAAGLAGLQTAYNPMLQDQRNALNQQAAILTGQPVAPFPEQPFPMPQYTNAGKQPTTPLPLTPKPAVAPSVVDPYSNITGPQAASAGYTGPNLYGQALAIGMPARDAMLPAYEYSPLAAGKTTRPASTYSTGNTPVSEATRKETQYQGLLDQGATPAQIRYARETMFGPQTSTGKSTFMNMGGIATLGAGGYPRRTGQISGPGTEKSDSIPAMLSDGEFVMTAKAVRGAGKGSRRAGAKKMYALMHRLEKNSERG